VTDASMIPGTIGNEPHCDDCLNGGESCGCYSLTNDWRAQPHPEKRALEMRWKMVSGKARIKLKIYDGARKPFTEKQSILLRVHNGQTTNSFTKTMNTKSLNEGEVILNVDFFDNFADHYTVLVSADDYRDAGFFPVKVSPRAAQELSLMLVPSNPAFQFDPWDVITANHPKISQFLSLTPPARGAENNYGKTVKDHPKETACLLNLATAMSQISLANGTPLDYFRSIEWATLAPDRFFGYVLPELVSQVRAAVPKKLFAPELDPSFFHGDATSSFKEIRFGEANVQLTFHEKDQKTIGDDTCVRVESDIDYFKDLGAHAILEVVFNHITNSMTDPAQVYTLRWIAGKETGVPEFDPPYRLVE
jgi:hypothetical protein